MRKALILFVSLFAVVFFLETYADARRLGGGRSFGSRPQYQRSAPPPAAPQRSADAYQGQDRQPGQPGRPTGLFGGGRGLFGGLLMGGLIGSLLFGGNAAAGPGLLDFLVIGGGLFLLFRFLAARRMAAESGRAMSYEAQAPFGAPLGEGAPGSASSHERNLPPGFDEAEFLAGAKAAYVRLQSSWDKRDLEDIRQFASPEMWEEIRRQAEEDPAPGYTGIVEVKARLLEVKAVEDHTVGSVLFDSLLRESEEGTPEPVREVWHFSRKDSGPDSFWRLEGIQQVEG